MPNVSWEDIGGLDNVKRELQEVCFCCVLLFPFPLSFSNFVSGTCFAQDVLLWFGVWKWSLDVTLGGCTMKRYNLLSYTTLQRTIFLHHIAGYDFTCLFGVYSQRVLISQQKIRL